MLQNNDLMMSLSARRVWIEIIYVFSIIAKYMGHSLRGECGLKYVFTPPVVTYLGHSLRGECGLKSRLLKEKVKEVLVTLCEESVD